MWNSGQDIKISLQSGVQNVLATVLSLRNVGNILKIWNKTTYNGVTAKTAKEKGNIFKMRP